MTYENRLEYIRLAEQKRLTECERQLAAVRRGLASLVPAPLLSLFTWEDLALRVCGKTELDLDLLKVDRTASLVLLYSRLLTRAAEAHAVQGRRDGEGPARAVVLAGAAQFHSDREVPLPPLCLGPRAPSARGGAQTRGNENIPPSGEGVLS